LHAAEDEAIYIRSTAFKRLVPQIYHYTCAITRWRITSTKDDQILDACHIIPFSLSHDDTIQNGIALSPTLHRAFDRGLIAISDHYTVIVSPDIQENDAPHALRHLHDHRILLPENPAYHPSLDNLRAHRQTHGL
jgi:putative restriction endonuclease